MLPVCTCACAGAARQTTVNTATTPKNLFMRFLSKESEVVCNRKTLSKRFLRAPGHFAPLRLKNRLSPKSWIGGVRYTFRYETPTDLRQSNGLRLARGTCVGTDAGPVDIDDQ